MNHSPLINLFCGLSICGDIFILRYHMYYIEIDIDLKCVIYVQYIYEILVLRGKFFINNVD